MPYLLKQYIDIIWQPTYLFRYTATGPVGLAKNKKAVIVSSRGGDYSSSPMKAYDFVGPYLRSALGFAGITDVNFVLAQPMDMGPALAKPKLEEALKAAKELGARL